MEVASSCWGLGGAARNGMAERFGLVTTKEAKRGVISVQPGVVGSKVAFLRSHLMDAACHELPQAHERVR